MNSEQIQDLELDTPVKKEFQAQENDVEEKVKPIPKPNLLVSTESSSGIPTNQPSNSSSLKNHKEPETKETKESSSFDRAQIKDWIQSLVPPRLVNKVQRILDKSLHLLENEEAVKSRITSLLETLKSNPKITYTQQDEIQLSRIKTRRSALERLTMEQKKIYLKDILSPMIQERLSHPHLEEIQAKLLEMKMMDLLCLMEMNQEFQKTIEYHQAYINQQKTLSSLGFSLLCIGLLVMMLMIQKVL